MVVDFASLVYSLLKFLYYFEIGFVDILLTFGYTEIIGLYPLQYAKQSKVRKEMRTWISGTAKKYLSTTAA